ncbi:MAG: Thermonuclease [Candidatus Roizmanbacteria bacterium GW2011_GWC2_37_13]|uniref:Thermonuclease n=1 Tax=Candidatus Roizmanbacteria bacterium GW2011_GWC2_37_13 TaxID=1618486 RepID=A0A0G0GHI7_9BACT|nr:MAG: Thermonuclease [Candidatus Roizmanbacteria bacterium GW2011_GWC2_37_13]
MKKNFGKNLLIGFLGIIIFFFGFSFRNLFNKTDQNPTNNILLPNPKEGIYKVTKVLDGDTIVLETGEKLRYLGIDAPEWNDRWGEEAKKFNEEMVLGKKARIELDRVKLDKYGRILGYVWIGDILVNEALVERGYAKVNLIKGEAKPKHLDRLKKAEDWARDHHDGVWFDEWTLLSI